MYLNRYSPRAKLIYSSVANESIFSLMNQTFFVLKEGNCSWPSGVGAPGVVLASRPAEDIENSENLIWRVLLGERIGSNGVLANISTNQLLTRRDGLSSEGPLELDYSSLEQAGLNGSLLEFTLGQQRNDTGDFLLLNRTVTTILRNRSNRTR